MKKNNVTIGATYLVKVGANLAPVVIVSENPNGGWNGESAKTGRPIRIKSAQRLRRKLPSESDAAPTSPTAAPKTKESTKRTPSAKQRDTGEHVATRGQREGKLSGLDAAAQVLADAGEPMNCKSLIFAMSERGLWTSPNGKTPANTLYAAIQREINVKGGDSRFAKAERGLFAFKGLRT